MPPPTFQPPVVPVTINYGNTSPETMESTITRPMENAGLLAFRRDAPPPEGVFARTEFLTAAGDLREAAVRFFAALRALDESGVEQLVAEPVPEVNLGRAIMERLRRAAAGSGTAQPP